MGTRGLAEIVKAGIIARPVTAEGRAKGARMPSSLAVFYPDKLVAHFPSRVPESVSVHRVDGQGRDGGREREARFTAAVGNSK